MLKTPFFVLALMTGVLAPAAAPQNPVAPVIRTTFVNLWTHPGTGRVYEGRDQSFLRNGQVVVDLDCEGFGMVRGQMGQTCQGQWFDQTGKASGEYRGVYVVNSESRLPMLVGELTTRAAPETWTPWDLQEMTPSEARAAGAYASRQ